MLLTVVLVAYILLAPPTARQIIAGGGSVGELSSSNLPETAYNAEEPFFGTSGVYNVNFTLSEITSDDPDTLAAADGIRDELFPGVLSISIDESGVGTLSIQQIFVSQEDIPVSAFVDSQGVRSNNTLYGYVMRGGMKLSVVCVFEESSLSGFIWLDDDATHIEFLYFE